LRALTLVTDFELADCDAGLFAETLGAAIGCLVEGFVGLAADVVDDRGLERLRRLEGSGARERAAQCQADQAQAHRTRPSRHPL